MLGDGFQFDEIERTNIDAQHKEHTMQIYIACVVHIKLRTFRLKSMFQKEFYCISVAMEFSKLNTVEKIRNLAYASISFVSFGLVFCFYKNIFDNDKKIME